MSLKSSVWVASAVLALVIAAFAIARGFNIGNWGPLGPADPNPPRFLSAAHGHSDEARAKAYYQQVGSISWNGAQCVGQRCTLAGWKTANGFGGADEVRGVYYNEGELGLGRDVHCREVNPVKVACYVTNFGSSIPADMWVALPNASVGANPRETLAMEAVRSFGQDEGDTWFFAYSAAPGNALSLKVTLDNEGEKYLPNVCQACHGGEYSFQKNQFVGGTMLPFDAPTFWVLGAGMAPRRVGGTGDPFQDTFRQLNGFVLDSRGRSVHFQSEPPTYTFGDPIRDLINGWYGHCSNLSQPANGGALRQAQGCTLDDAYLPPGWTAKPVLYQTVYRKYCRSCHNALTHGIEFTAWSQFASWGGATNSAGIAGLVCNVGGPAYMIMPNAEATYKRFWAGTAPADLKAEFNFASCMQ